MAIFATNKISPLMSFDLAGKIIEIFDTQQVKDNFRKREFVVEVPGDFGRYNQIKFELLQEQVDLVSDFGVGDEVKVHFDIRGSRWERDGRVSYFTNLKAWRIDRMGAGEGDAPPQSPSMDQAPPPPPPPTSDSNADTLEDDLPF